MNRNEAKLILDVSRPGDEAEADPQLAEALALAQADPELGAWLAQERAWDAAVRRELQTVPVPPNLSAQIRPQPKIVPLPMEEKAASWFSLRSPLVWAMAAAVVLFLGLAVNWTRSHSGMQVASFARDMIAASPVDAHHVDMLNADFSKVKGWLADRQAPADIDLPPAIKNAPGLMGCRIMSWHGQPVSMLCFMMPGARHVDLFVTSAAQFADAPAPGQPMFASINQNAMASWRVGNQLYVLAGQVPEEFLRHCLAPATTARVQDGVLLADIF